MHLVLFRGYREMIRKNVNPVFCEAKTINLLMYMFNPMTVVLKFVGGIESNKCHVGSRHQTLSYNQEWIQKILVGVQF